MLHITLTVSHTSAPDVTLEAEIANETNLDTLSSYSFDFDCRGTSASLTGYPRWSESSLGLLCRAIELTTLDSYSAALRDDWRKLFLKIDLWPAGRWSRAKSLIRLVAYRTGDGLDVRYVEEPGLIWGQGVGRVRLAYADYWDLAGHAARLILFGSDVLPEAEPLNVPSQNGIVFAQDIPFYTRAMFAHRQRYSGRPALSRESYWAHDFEDWLNGHR